MTQILIQGESTHEDDSFLRSQDQVAPETDTLETPPQEGQTKHRRNLSATVRESIMQKVREKRIEERVQEEWKSIQKIQRKTSLRGNESKVIERYPFDADFMKQDALANQFFDSIVQDVPLREIKNVVTSCHFDANMKFCAIITELMDESVKKCHQGNYLMEIWSGGTLLYQRPLNQKVKAMYVSRHNNSLIYQLHPEDENPDQNQIDTGAPFIHIINLNETVESCTNAYQAEEELFMDIKETKIQDWTGLCSKDERVNFALSKENVLFVSTTGTLCAASIDIDKIRAINDTTSINGGVQGSSDAYMITPETPQGRLDFDINYRLLLLYDTQESYKNNEGDSVLSVFDKQSLLDFNQIEITVDKADPSKLNMKLIQQEELIHKKKWQPAAQDGRRLTVKTQDKIKDYWHMCLKGKKEATIVVRESGYLDFYFNCKRVSSTDENEEDRMYEYSDVHMNFNAAMFTRRLRFNVNQVSEDPSAANSDHKVLLDLSQEQRTSFSSVVFLPDLEEYQRSFFQNQKYRDLIKPFQNFILYKTFMLVAHGNILSYYDTKLKIWKCHHRFTDSDDVEDSRSSIGLNRTYAYVLKKKVVNVFRHEITNKNGLGIGVLFQDGTIERLLINEREDGVTQMKQLESSGTRIEGRIMQIASDREHSRMLYVTSQLKDDSVKIWGYTQGNLYDLTQYMEAAITPESKIVPYFAPAENTQFILMNPNESTLRIYEHHFDEEDGNKTLKLVRVKKIRHKSLCDINVHCVHTAFSTSQNEMLALIDDKDMFLYDLKGIDLSQGARSEIFSVKNSSVHCRVNYQGVQLIEDRYMYILYNKRAQDFTNKMTNSEAREQNMEMQNATMTLLQSGNGAGFIDISPLKQDITAKCNLIPICEAIVGTNNSITFSESNQKLVFLQGFNRLKIIPILHQNVLRLENSQQKKNYLHGSQWKDKFVALSRRDNKIHKWDMQTGKQLCNLSREFKISPNHDNSEYEIYKNHGEIESNQEMPLYQQGVLKHTLVYEKQKDLVMTDEKFYPSERIERADYQVNRLISLEKSFHQFHVLGLDEATGEMQVKASFVFPRLLKHDQHLFVSDDCTRLLEIIGEEAYIYNIEQMSLKGKNFSALSVRVPRLPFGICDGDIFQLFCLFSPDLKLVIDIEPMDRSWVVRRVDNGQIHFMIPRTFLSLSHQSRLITRQARFISWASNKRITMIDIAAEPYIEETIEIPDVPEDPPALSYEVASGTVPYLDMEPYKTCYKSQDGSSNRQLGTSNYFKAMLRYDTGDVMSRLKRKHRVLKNIWYMQTGDKDIEKQVERCQEGRHGSVYEHLFSMDYVSSPNHFLIETPFTFIHWRRIELASMLTNQTTLAASEQIADISYTRDMAQVISLNILPEVRTVMHKITRNYQFITMFCQMATITEDDTIFPVPFLEDMDGKTALHLSLDGPSQNPRVAEYFLKDLLQKMPLDHHGRGIADIIPMCVEMNIRYLGEYLDSRFVTTKQLKKVCRASKMQLRVDPENEEGDFFTTICDLWPDQRFIKKQVYEESEHGDEITIRILDIPKLHNPNELFAEQLAEQLANRRETDIFKFKAIQAIVNFRWGITKDYVLKRQMAPYCVFFISYLFYALYLFDADEENQDVIDDGKAKAATILFSAFDKGWLLVLLFFSGWFLSQEIRQIIKIDCWYNYFLDVWNYTDVVPPVIIIILVLLDLFHIGDETGKMKKFRFTLQAIASFGMWLKIFYFLRIFRQTGFFVNMLLRVIRISKVFFLLYMLILCSFASSFFIMDSTNQGLWYHLNYSYLLGLGEFDMDWSDNYITPIVVQMFFYAATLLVMIVMLNLLIAIVSEAYEEVINTQREANDFERINLISDVSKFIKKDIKMNLCKENQYLVIAQNVANNDDDDKDIDSD